jgi:hypothetical protein
VTVTVTKSAPKPAPTHSSAPAPQSYQGFCRTRDATNQGWNYYNASSAQLQFLTLDVTNGLETFGYPGFRNPDGSIALMRKYTDGHSTFASVNAAPAGNQWENQIQVLDEHLNWVALPDYMAAHAGAKLADVQSGNNAWIASWRSIAYAGSTVPHC